MSLLYSNAIRDAQLDAIESTIGEAPKIRIYAAGVGQELANNFTDVDTGAVMLCEIIAPADWLAPAADGAISQTEAFAGAVIVEGIPAFFVIYAADGTTPHIMGSVSGASGGGDIQIDGDTIFVGQNIALDYFLLLSGNPNGAPQ